MLKKLLTSIIIALALLLSRNHNCLYNHKSRVTFHPIVCPPIIMFLSRHEYPWSYTRTHMSFLNAQLSNFFWLTWFSFLCLKTRFKLQMIKLNSKIRVALSSIFFTKVFMVLLINKYSKMMVASSLGRTDKTRVSKLFCSLIKHWNVLIFNYLFHCLILE